MAQVLNRRAALVGAASAATVGAAAHAAIPGRVGRVSARPKLSLFLARAEGLTREAFADNWAASEPERLASISGLTGLVFNVVDAERTPGSPYDGVAELEFRDVHALDRALNSEALGRTQSAARPNPFALVTSTVVIRALSDVHSGAKRIGLVSRPPGHDRMDFYRAWRDEHGAEVTKQPALTGYMLNLTDPRRSTGAAWDGYAELWWKDWAVFDASMKVRDAVREPSAASFFQNHLLLLVTERLRRRGVRA